MEEPSAEFLVRSARFGLAPPRRFLLPALLLLLSESPSHGYRLEKELASLRFGRVDRPAVYRALSQLEADGLVESWFEAARGGHERRTFALTPLGERVLAAWMAVVKEERDGLSEVLRRYQATGRADALVSGTGEPGAPPGWSALSTTAPGPPPASLVLPRRPEGPPAQADLRGHRDPGRPAQPEPEGSGGGEGPPARGEVRMVRHSVVPDRSVLLIEARSTVGPISFGAMGITGWVRAGLRSGDLALDVAPAAHLEVAVDGLRSGNALYDAELLQRIDARRYPRATLDLRSASPLADGRVALEGELTFHGVTRTVEGVVAVQRMADGRLVVTGEQSFDIRDFGLVSPTVLMLRIFPDVRVRLHVEAEPELRWS